VNDKDKRDAVIYDVQGTLIDVLSIRHLVEGPKKDFDAFHNATLVCPPNWEVLEQCQRDHADGLDILVVSGMTDVFRTGLGQWLATYMIHPAVVRMRPDGDWCADVVLKARIANELEEDYNILHATDDNPGIVALWERRGYPVTVVPGWGT
jgi:hypothetical protein